jgi:hypothetical protein
MAVRVKVKVKEIDIEWARLLNIFMRMKKSRTKVGFPFGERIGQSNNNGSGHDEYHNMSEVAKIAAFQEFGTRYIPQRPFMRTSYNENIDELKILRDNIYDKIVDGSMTLRQGLAIMGEFMEGKIKQKITDINKPSLKKRTIKAKKSSNPLIDTGQMRNSVTHSEVIK